MKKRNNPKRREYTLTQEDYDFINKACNPPEGPALPYFKQKRINDAWCVLGEKLGFKGLTARKSIKGRLTITAVPERKK